MHLFKQLLLSCKTESGKIETEGAALNTQHWQFDAVVEMSLCQYLGHLWNNTLRFEDQLVLGMTRDTNFAFFDIVQGGGGGGQTQGSLRVKLSRF